MHERAERVEDGWRGEALFVVDRGVGRGELGKKLDLSVGELGRAFRALNPDKKWSELKKLHDQKSKAKPASKEGRTQQRRAA